MYALFFRNQLTMAAFELTDLFGTSVYKEINDTGYTHLLIRLNDFRGISDYGNLPDEVGTNDPDGLTPVQIFYSLILLVLNNQAVNLNADPEQKIFVTESAKSILTGAREGQVKRSFTVNFFSDEGLGGTTGVDYV